MLFQNPRTSSDKSRAKKFRQKRPPKNRNKLAFPKAFVIIRRCSYQRKIQASIRPSISRGFDAFAVTGLKAHAAPKSSVIQPVPWRAGQMKMAPQAERGGLNLRKSAVDFLPPLRSSRPLRLNLRSSPVKPGQARSSPVKAQQSENI